MITNSPLLRTFILLAALAATLAACSPGTEATSPRTAAATAPLSTPTRVGQTSSPAPSQVKVSPIDGATMVYVPADTYTWGVHEKRRSAFWIDKYEVTNERFKKFMDAGGYTNSAYWSQTGWKWLQSEGITQPLYWNDKRYNTPQQPVVGVSWYEADAYARWAGKRLPTTLEWQAAAQGTDNRIWPWGSVWDPAKANAGDGSRGAPVAVGLTPPGLVPLAPSTWPAMCGNTRLIGTCCVRAATSIRTAWPSAAHGITVTSLGQPPRLAKSVAEVSG
jgi:formylglycine-generating enzyme required for sulfatase activity